MFDFQKLRNKIKVIRGLRFYDNWVKEDVSSVKSNFPHLCFGPDFLAAIEFWPLSCALEVGDT